MPSKTYTIVRLPTYNKGEDSNVQAIARQYRSFRLGALLADPDVFASSHFEESREGGEFWIDRLRNPGAVFHVAVANDSSRQSDAEQSQWMGMIVALGPHEETAHTAKVSPWSGEHATSSHQDETAKTTQGSPRSIALRYQLVGFFVDKQWRGRGVGAALIRAAVDGGNQDCSNLRHSRVVCAIHVEADNEVAIHLYQKLGFVTVGEEMYTPRPTASGPRPEKRALFMEHSSLR